MSSKYFFKKWKEVLIRLERLVDSDTEFQNSKINEPTLCLISKRLSGILGAYIASFNEMLDCYKMNTQVQKKTYMHAVLQGVVARIIELKHQLSKLDGSNYQFLSYGLMLHKLTPFDAEFIDIPNKKVRSQEMQQILEGIKEKVEEERERIEAERKAALAAEEVQEEENKLWWEDTNDTNQSEDEYDPYEVTKKISEETLMRWKLVNVIKAHEKTRIVIAHMKRQMLKRDNWIKQLEGTAQPQARSELKHRGAKLIQRVFRYYFELKRTSIVNCKRDALLGYSLCKIPTPEARKKNEKILDIRAKKFVTLEKEWKTACEKFKEDYSKRMAADIAEDFRNKITSWFREWFDKVKFFYDIPTEAKGGSVLIINEEIITPSEWQSNYAAYLQQLKANKNKSSDQLKKEKAEAKKEVLRAKREKILKQKREEHMLKKLMKYPKSHPGYTYPASKKTDLLLKAIEQYHNDWNELDNSEIAEAKEGYYKQYDIDNICMEVKLEVLKQVDVHMRDELKKLKKALKKDYQNNEMEMPQTIKQPKIRTKKQKTKKTTPVNIDVITKHLVSLCLYDIYKEYPKTQFEDFLGDPNIIGEDFRCNYKFPVQPGNGEIRSLWWEKCSELTQGFRRVVLVGPKGSGRTVLVHAMASLNNAVLFELSPLLFGSEDTSSVQIIQNLVTSLIACAKAFQPTVIYIRDLHLLYGKKNKMAIPGVDVNELKKLLIKKLFKGFQKTDNVTVVGTCTEPWNLRSRQLLKQFPNAILMPNTSYQTVFQLLQKWVLENRQLPRDLDISSLAYVLQGYRYGYLKVFLDTFLTAERIIKIPVEGFNPMDIYDYILEHQTETKVDYEKYIKWYQEQTLWGNKEKKHAKQQLEYKELMEKYELQKKKKKKAMSAPSSNASSFADLTDQNSVKTYNHRSDKSSQK